MSFARVVMAMPFKTPDEELGPATASRQGVNRALERSLDRAWHLLRRDTSVGGY
jgi:hypothetical protein